MKKTLTVLILLLAAVSAFALNAKVLDVVGKVEIQQADGNWKSVAPGDVLGPGTILSTGFKSEAVISIDETTINVKALTRLTIEKLYEQEGNKASSFYLDAGALSADVKSAEDKKVSFKVKTPAVTASVRGTAGDLTVNSLVGTSGTWLLTPPEPKAISYNRGDAAPSSTEEEASSAPAPAATEAAATEAGAEEAAAAEEAGGDDFDWSIDNGEVTVQPGQAASFEVGQDIVTPMETAAAAATSTGGTQSLSAKEAVSSSAAPAAANGANEVLAAANSALSADLAVGGGVPVPAPAPAASHGSITVTLTWPTL